MMHKFALIGAAGFVAPRHMKAIQDVGGELVAALDVHDSVGILDRYFPTCRFFTSPERFDRYLNKMSGEIDYVSICSPNWLHDAHCRWALRSGAHAICEKPLVLNPWNVDQLAEIEAETDRRVYPILQLRLHPNVVTLRQQMLDIERVKIRLDYVTRRGAWYAESWKGDETKSGGILMNLGIHFFDMACWMFGEPEILDAERRENGSCRGVVQFERAELDWFLSSKAEDLPDGAAGPAYRHLSFGDQHVDFSTGFTDLHTLAYRSILDGNSPGLASTRPAIALVSQIRKLLL